MKPIIISLSGKARNGKDTTVQIIKEKLEKNNKRCLCMAYGNEVKFIAEKYYGWNGEKDEVGRTILQQLGTEKVRYKDENFWVDSVIRLVDVIGEDFDYILLSDSRFKNELERWETKGYYIISVHANRPNFDNGLTPEQKLHPSETSLDNFEFDYYLSAETLEELENEVNSKLGFLFNK